MSNEKLGEILAVKAAIFDCIRIIEIETFKKSEFIKKLQELENEKEVL